MAGLTQRVAQALAHDVGESAEKQVLVWGAAALIPALTSFLWLACVPPFWPGTDSTTILLWPRGIVPHYPLLYPGVIELFEYLFGINPDMLRYLLISQHLILIISIIYLSSVFRRKVHAVVLSFVALAGTWFASFAHGVATQAIELPFLVFLFGVMLRFYLNGWRASLLPILAIAMLGLSLSRHASIVITVVAPVYWVTLAALAFKRREPVGQYLVYTVVCASIVCSAFVASIAITQWSCLVLKRDCTSVLGRAGYYRILDVYNLIPPDKRSAWIEEKTRGLSTETAIAFNAMATDTSGGWLGAQNSLVKRFPDINPDRVMNDVFIQFLLSPDKYSLSQMISEFGGGLYLVRSKYMQERMIGWFIGNTVTVLSARALPSDAHAEMRARLGVRGPADAAALQSLPIDGLARSYDWYTFHLLNGVAVALFVCALILVRDDRTNALAVSFFVTALTFIAAVSTVTVVLPHYVQPLNFIMFLATGIFLIVLSTWFGRMLTRWAVNHGDVLKR